MLSLGKKFLSDRGTLLGTCCFQGRHSGRSREDKGYHGMFSS